MCKCWNFEQEFFHAKKQQQNYNFKLAANATSQVQRDKIDKVNISTYTVICGLWNVNE